MRLPPDGAEPADPCAGGDAQSGHHGPHRGGDPGRPAAVQLHQGLPGGQRRHHRPGLHHPGPGGGRREIPGGGPGPGGLCAGGLQQVRPGDGSGDLPL